VKRFAPYVYMGVHSLSIELLANLSPHTRFPLNLLEGKTTKEKAWGKSNSRADQAIRGCTPSISKYLSPWLFSTTLIICLIKKYASTIYFVCYMLYCCMYFKLGLSFYMFAINFFNKMNDQGCKKKSTTTNISIRRGWYISIVFDMHERVLILFVWLISHQPALLCS
jgi:hypothetical protein